MDIEPSPRIFRVTVRGRFHELTDESRRYLVGAQQDHDIFKSSFSQEGTFTYDSKIDFFNLRYEVRATGPDAEARATDQALAEAERFLRTMKIGHRNLRASLVDMSAMWDAQARKREGRRS